MIEIIIIDIVVMVEIMVVVMIAVSSYYKSYDSIYSGTVRPLLSADLYYPRFSRPKLSTPNVYEIQSNLY